MEPTVASATVQTIMNADGDLRRTKRRRRRSITQVERLPLWAVGPLPSVPHNNWRSPIMPQPVHMDLCVNCNWNSFFYWLIITQGLFSIKEYREIFPDNIFSFKFTIALMVYIYIFTYHWKMCICLICNTISSYM